jgi:hypothetical protein
MATIRRLRATDRVAGTDDRDHRGGTPSGVVLADERRTDSMELEAATSWTVGGHVCQARATLRISWSAAEGSFVVRGKRASGRRARRPSGPAHDRVQPDTAGLACGDEHDEQLGGRRRRRA